MDNMQNIKTPPSHPSPLDSSNDHRDSNKSDDDNDDDTEPSSSFDLNKVMHQFGDNVELLELILSSKLEEDRRRTEEAKLKSKQLDYLIQAKKDEKLNQSSYQPDAPMTNSAPELTPEPRRSLHYDHNNSTTYTPERHSAVSPTYRQGGEDERNIQTATSRFPSVSLSTPLPSIDSLDRRPSSFFATTPSTLTYSEPDVSRPAFVHHQRSISNPPAHRDFFLNPRTLHDPPGKLPIPPSPGPSDPTPPHQSFKRRRREMQTITMIIETKEYPYNDSYHWKNNGNTVHKKTGQRSIYYKCSNAVKGCHVNKTVTFKGQGEYLIKYRGKHLDECQADQDPSMR